MNDLTVLEPTEPGTTSGLRRIVYLALGWFFLGMAILGALLPVLPTTPFLLLTSYFFLRSSKWLHARLLASRVFGPLLADWHLHRGVRLHVKVTAVAVILLSIFASVAWGQLSWPLLTLLAIGGTVGLLVVLRLRVIDDTSSAEPRTTLRLRDLDEEAA